MKCSDIKTGDVFVHGHEHGWTFIALILKSEIRDDKVYISWCDLPAGYQYTISYLVHEPMRRFSDGIHIQSNDL
jgi:hypothetical protein